MTLFTRGTDPQDTIDEAETSTFGLQAKTFIPGKNSGVLNLDMLFDGTAVTGSHAVMLSYLGVLHAASLIYGGNVLGNAVTFLYGFLKQRGELSKVKDAVAMVCSMRGSPGLDYGFLEHILVAETATNATPTSIDRGATNTTSVGWAAVLHATAIIGTPTLTVILEDSADNITFATLGGGAFAAVTGVGDQEVVGGAAVSVRRYVRARWTMSGGTPSVTFAIAFAPRTF
jgi:hypothetical protein